MHELQEHIFSQLTANMSATVAQPAVNGEVAFERLSGASPVDERRYCDTPCRPRLTGRCKQGYN